MLKTSLYFSIKYICHEVNINGSAARNTGVRCSKGEFISLLDDDDTFFPRKIESQLAALKACGEDYAICYCSKETYNATTKVGERHVTKSGDLLYDVLLHDVIISSTSLFIKRRVWEEFGGFDESFRRHQDWEFTVRVTSKYKVIALDEILYRDYVLERYTPRNADQAKCLRDYYLEKMEPYLNLLSPQQKKTVIQMEKRDLAFRFIKEHKFKKAHQELKEAGLGITTYFYFIKRIIKYCFKKK